MNTSYVLKVAVVAFGLSFAPMRAMAADIWWIPVSASGDHEIIGSEIVVTPGQRVYLELRLGGWAPDLLSTWQGSLDAALLGSTCSGGDNAGAACFSDVDCLIGGVCTADRPGPLVPAVEACAVDGECKTAFAEDGARCDDTFGLCAPGWQNGNRADFVIIGGLNIVSTAFPDIRFGSTLLFTNPVADAGIDYYGGHLALDVPAEATGSYTVGLLGGASSFIVDSNGDPVLPVNLTGATITVICTSDVFCDDGVYCNGQETCVDGNCVVGTDPCNPGIECDEGNDICLVECAVDTECDDLNDCTQNLCPIETSRCSYPPENAGTICGNQSQTECDDPNTCDGAGTCLDNFVGVGIACGDPTITQCDDADICDGAGDCSDNLVADGTPCDSGSVCLGAGGCLVGLCEETPVSAPPLVARLGGGLNLLVTPQPPDSTAPVALRVTSPDWPCLDLYVDTDGSLVTDPVEQHPGAWGTVVVVGGENMEIVPDSTYEVVAECGGVPTAPGSGMSSLFGDFVDFDVEPPSVDFRDIAFSVNAFLDNTIAPIVVSDIAPCPPDKAVDFRDISLTVELFLGAPYPCDVPCP